MTSPEEFLAELDHVVGDYSISGDAMRWRPEPEPEDRRQIQIREFGGDLREADLNAALSEGARRVQRNEPFGLDEDDAEQAAFLDELIADRIHNADRLERIRASWDTWAERNTARGWGSGGRLADESEHDPAGAYERRRQERRGIDIRWTDDYPPVIEDEAVPPARAYISTTDRPFDPASPEWVPLDVWNRANPPMPMPNELAEWQQRIVESLARFVEPGPLDHSPEIPMDRDRPGHRLHEANGVQAQRSPYGRQGRMIPPARTARSPFRRSHRRHSRRAS